MLRRCEICRSEFGCLPDDGKLRCVRCARLPETQGCDPEGIAGEVRIADASTNLLLSEVPAVVQSLTGRAPAIDTIKRWVRDGYYGNKLRIAGMGKFRFTRREWVEEFLVACGNRRNAADAVARKIDSKLDEAEAAVERLRKKGYVVGGPSE